VSSSLFGASKHLANTRKERHSSSVSHNCRLAYCRHCDLLRTCAKCIHTVSSAKAVDFNLSCTTEPFFVYCLCRLEESYCWSRVIVITSCVIAQSTPQQCSIGTTERKANQRHSHCDQDMCIHICIDRCMPAYIALSCMHSCCHVTPCYVVAPYCNLA
jgi:hypothetical protein